ncbi:hypothetical protein EON82_11620, partial [bacterium]
MSTLSVGPLPHVAAKPAPSRAKRSDWFYLNAFCAFLFISMAVILVVTGMKGIYDASLYYFVSLVSLAPLAVMIRFRAKSWRPRLLIADCLLFLVCASGLFALGGRRIEETIMPAGFAITVLLRGLMLFTFLPRSRAALGLP